LQRERGGGRKKAPFGPSIPFPLSFPCCLVGGGLKKGGGKGKRGQARTAAAALFTLMFWFERAYCWGGTRGGRRKELSKRKKRGRKDANHPSSLPGYRKKKGREKKKRGENAGRAIRPRLDLGRSAFTKEGGRTGKGRGGGVPKLAARILSTP